MCLFKARGRVNLSKESYRVGYLVLKLKVYSSGQPQCSVHILLGELLGKREIHTNNDEHSEVSALKLEPGLPSLPIKPLLTTTVLNIISKYAIMEPQS